MTEMPCGDPVFCQCPPFWFGVVPPACPVHNPATFSVPSTFLTGASQPTLSDADVERIAQRVVELLKEAKP